MNVAIKYCAAGMAAALALCGMPSHAAVITNGGFESGLAGWTAVNQTGSDGAFVLQSGTTSPLSGTAVPAPPGGSNAAMTDSQGPGSHVLYQDFMQAGPVASALLSFDLFVGNRAEAFHTPPTLDFSTPALNQQARVDILLAGTDPFSLALGEVLAGLYMSTPGDALVADYRHFEIDITDLLNANLNTGLRLRFSEVDNVNLFQLGVDNVMLVTEERTATVPEPGSWGLAAAGLAAAVLSRRRSAPRRLR